MAAGEAEVREAAVRLLARREHSRRELGFKLRGRGFAGPLVEEVLSELEQQRLLSDERYAEVLVRSRIANGYGPLRIRAELREHGVEAAVVEGQLAEQAPDWTALAVKVRKRRFGEAVPGDFRERAKQVRFLQHRGFDGEQIRAAVERGD